jgi:hypothetical protein
MLPLPLHVLLCDYSIVLSTTDAIKKMVLQIKCQSLPLQEHPGFCTMHAPEQGRADLRSPPKFGETFGRTRLDIME